LSRTATSLRIEELPVPDPGAESLFRASFGAPPPDFPLHYVARNAMGRVLGYIHYTQQEPGLYLCGGLCVDARSYREMSASQRDALREAGSLSRWLLRESIAALPSKQAVFAYTGNVVSLRDGLASGFQETGHRYLIVQWHAAPTAERVAIVERIAKLGPF
jgi:hypothetical protein